MISAYSKIFIRCPTCFLVVRKSLCTAQAASTKENDWILDLFTGSSTTGIAANLLNRRFLGLDNEISFLELSKKRREEINVIKKYSEYREKIIRYNSAIFVHKPRISVTADQSILLK